MSSSPDSAPSVAALVVAGGVGKRMGVAIPKQYIEVAGRPVLLRAIQPFLEHPAVSVVIVVIPVADLPGPPSWLRDLDVRLVAGGEERSESVWNGLAAVPHECEIVLVHDGARPFVSRALIDRVIEAASRGAATAALPVGDTIKEVNEAAVVISTPDRARLWQAQTPQGFLRSVLVAAHEKARAEGSSATDDAALVENLGVLVEVVEGAPENLKITQPLDLILAEALAARACAD